MVSTTGQGKGDAFTGAGNGPSSASSCSATAMPKASIKKRSRP